MGPKELSDGSKQKRVCFVPIANLGAAFIRDIMKMHYCTQGDRRFNSWKLFVCICPVPQDRASHHSLTLQTAIFTFQRSDFLLPKLP